MALTGRTPISTTSNDDRSIPDFARTLALELESLERMPSLLPVSDFALEREIGFGYDGAIILASSKKEPTELFVLKETRLGTSSPDDEDPSQDTDQRPRLRYDTLRQFSIHRSLSLLPNDESKDEGRDSILRATAIIAGEGSPIRELYLALDYVPVTLSALLDECADQGIDLGPANTKHLFRQLLSGLDWIHGHGVVHRDLSPSNLLVTPQGGLKIADFGEARACHVRYGEPDSNVSSRDRMTRRRTTLWWRAPEVCLGSDVYDASADIWSAGCVLAEMLLMEPLLQGDDDLDMLVLIGKLLGPPKAEALEALRIYEPIDWDAWRARCDPDDQPRPDGSTGSLNLKFKGHGDLAIKMLRIFLDWDPRARRSAKEALCASGPGPHHGRGAAIWTRPQAWWRTGPVPEEHTLGQEGVLNEVMERLSRSG